MNRPTGDPPEGIPEYLIQAFSWNGERSCTVEDFGFAQIRWIEVTQDYGTSIRLPVRQFTPIGEEGLTWRWLKDDGRIGEYETPPFAIANVKRAKQEIELSFLSNLSSYIKNTLDKSNIIICNTFAMILNIVHSEPVSSSCKIWFCFLC